MRKMMKAIAAVLAVSAMMVGTAFATEKLIVKGTDGTTTVASISDTGMILLPNSSGTNRGAGLVNAGALNNFALISVAPDPAVASAGASLQMVPKGTGYSASLKAQMTVFNTDFNADGNNYEAMVLRAAGSKFSINSVSVGTGLQRPIEFQIQNAAKMSIATNGYVGIGTTTPTSPLAVAGLRTFADNAAALADPTPLKAGDFYRTSTGQLMVVY
jgi:hypothetical protein